MSAVAGEPHGAGPSDERSGGPSEHGPSEHRPSEHGPASYAPGTGRRPDRSLPLLSPGTEFRPEPPWRQPAGPSTDVAPMELGRISPKKLIVAVPPDPPRRSFGATVWFIGIAVIAGGVGGYMAGHIQRTAAPEQPSPIAQPEHAIVATAPVATPETVPARTSTPRLTVGAVRELRADEPAPLTILYWDGGLSVSVVIDGLAPGSMLDPGTPAAPNGWRLAAADLQRAVIWPPHGFVGVMDLTVELRLADDTVVDRKSLQVTWSGGSAPAPTAPAERVPAPTVSAEPSQRQLDASEIALLMKRGQDLMASGDIVAARMMFQPAAEAGDARAAFALAQTYDPLVLEKLATTGIASDIALARRWYEKAKVLRSAEAPERLNEGAR